MKKVILIALIVMFIIDAFSQPNIMQTPNFKFRTIKKGYTGDWAGSQTDTAGNNGMNYNALKSEMLWNKIFSPLYWLQSSFRDSLRSDTVLLIETQDRTNKLLQNYFQGADTQYYYKRLTVDALLNMKPNSADSNSSTGWYRRGYIDALQSLNFKYADTSGSNGFYRRGYMDAWMANKPSWSDTVQPGGSMPSKHQMDSAAALKADKADSNSATKGFYPRQQVDAIEATKQNIITMLDDTLNYKIITGTAEGSAGYYNCNSGGFTANNNYLSKKFVVDPLKIYCVTTNMSGDVTAAAVYYTSGGVYISKENVGANLVASKVANKYQLSIPPTAGIVGVTNKSNVEYGRLYQIKGSVTGVPEASKGYYNCNSGVFASDINYSSVKLTIDPAKTYYATGRVSGAIVALAVYWDANGTYIGYQYVGFNPAVYSSIYYLNQKLTIPYNAVTVGLTNYLTDSDAKGNPTLRVINNANNSETVLNSYNYLNWKGKKIVHFGTSISTFNIPEKYADLLGATIYDEALGSSMVRAFRYDGFIKGMPYTVILRSLSHTIAEKQYIMDHWASMGGGYRSTGQPDVDSAYGARDLLTSSPPVSYTTYASAAQILSYSYENKLVAKYLNSSNSNYLCAPDLFVFEHGYNDLVDAAYDLDSASSVSPSGVDRSTFGGAMNYIINIILTYNPRAKIALIGHYENQIHPNVAVAQLNWAAYWQFPLLKTWEKTGWSQRTVTTTGYWTDQYVWNNSGGSPTSMTIKQIWLYDDLHPGSNAAQDLLAKLCAEFIKGL